MTPPAAPTLQRRFPQTWPWLAAVVLLVVHFALAVGSKRLQSTTADEIAHLTAGVSYWKFNDYRLQPENGNLPQRWAALPTHLRGATFPELNQPAWHGSDPWMLGHQFFYQTGEDHFPRLMAGRAMIALFSVGTGILVFCWSRRLFGSGAGLFSLALFAFCPSFLAHGALVTSDVCMTFFFVASLAAWWRHLHDGRAFPWLLSCLTFGLACVAKFSAVLLLPMIGLLGLARVLSPADLVLWGKACTTRPAKFAGVIASFASHGAIALLMIWASFGFRYAAANPKLPELVSFSQPWSEVLRDSGHHGKMIETLLRAKVLPEAFVYGYAFVVKYAQKRSAFLNGNYSDTGWRSFFLWTFTLKTPFPVLIALVGVTAIGAIRARRHPAAARAKAYKALPLLVLFSVYGAFSVASHLNIGHRHILPIYPPLFVALGALVSSVGNMRSGRIAIVVLLAWQAIAALRAAPAYIAYFNPFFGGPTQAHRHLVDSSLDWGQELPRLKQWLDRHAGSEPVYLAYFGTGEPDYYGIEARRIIMIDGFKRPPALVPLEPGIYCISATALEQVYGPWRGSWSIKNEEQYQALRPMEPAFLDYDRNPANRSKWEKEISASRWHELRELYRQLRFARLCLYLRARPPDEQIGYAINIYRLSAAEIDAAVHRDISALRSAIEALAPPRGPSD